MEEPGRCPLWSVSLPAPAWGGGPTPIQTDKAAALCAEDQAGSQAMDPEADRTSEQPGLRREIQPMPLEPKLMEETVPALRKPPA